MFRFLLAKTVIFPMNFILPLLVAWLVIMAIRETIRSDRNWQVFWCYTFMTGIFLVMGWPPQFMQDPYNRPEVITRVP